MAAHLLARSRMPAWIPRERTKLIAAIDFWIGANDRGAATVPVILPGFSHSRWFREAFPERVAY